ncbi:MAG: hypothetical protein COB02_10490 [Candidatus Cloacimonadota bacterium]|nr:MAG: hypothetical protein COB02_10490 [Candidatus Cloacimonadota bacterium]
MKLLLLTLLLQISLVANPNTFWGKRAQKLEKEGVLKTAIRYYKKAALENDQFAIDKLKSFEPKTKKIEPTKKQLQEIALNLTLKDLFKKQSFLAKQKTLEFFKSKLDNGINGLDLTKFIDAVLYNSSFTFTSRAKFKEFFENKSINLININLNHYQLTYHTLKTPKSLDRLSFSILDSVIFNDSIIIFDEDYDPFILDNKGYGEYQTLSFIDLDNKIWTKDLISRITKDALIQSKNKRKSRQIK